MVILIKLFPDFSDLKAFERRLTEVIADLAPSTLRWRSKWSAGYSWSTETYSLPFPFSRPLRLDGVYLFRGVPVGL